MAWIPTADCNRLSAFQEAESGIVAERYLEKRGEPAQGSSGKERDTRSGDSERIS